MRYQGPESPCSPGPESWKNSRWPGGFPGPPVTKSPNLLQFCTAGDQLPTMCSDPGSWCSGMTSVHELLQLVAAAGPPV